MIEEAYIKYQDWKPRGASLTLVDHCNVIIAEYLDDGFTLTLRQLYYQLVQKNLIANVEEEYNRLKQIVSRARRAGLLDWNAIEDRTRFLRERAHWNDPHEILDAAVESYHIDLWSDQKLRPEVWVEKDALIAIIGDVCRELDVPFTSSRGYPSDSEVWRAANRFQKHIEAGQAPMLIHLSDHDPSGLDMTRDLQERLGMFLGGCDRDWPVCRLALTKKQIDHYKLPSNPAKMTDTRIASYAEEFGCESWELDALRPRVIVDIVKAKIAEFTEHGKFRAKLKKREKERRALARKVKAAKKVGA